MGSDSIKKISEKLNSPHSPILLGEMEIPADDTIQLALGGLNPYSKHFDIIGHQFLNLLINNAGLTNDSRLLDIGCGTGRLAKQIDKNLDIKSYQGYDINLKYIDYCRKTYGDNLKFDHFDIKHDEYNNNGTINQQYFKLPYDANSFDIVVAIAVMNHLHYNDIANIITESSRVLKKNGVLFCTHTILNSKSISFIDNRRTQPYMFNYRTTDTWYDYEDRLLINTAHNEVDIRRLLIRNRLMIREPIRYGEWCGSKSSLCGPDVVISIKN